MLALSMPRPNWFFALPLNGDFVLNLPPPPVGFRCYQPEDIHLTLAFLGGCGETAALRALAVLDAALADASPAPFAVSLAGVVPMGSRRAYSALSALLEVGRHEVEAFISTQRDALSDAALVRREQRAPKAHVTIARPRPRATDAERRDGLAWAAGLDLRAIHGTLDRISLYTWHDDRKERLFRVVAERRFAGPEARSYATQEPRGQK
jgi:2'-5' RNA ligase